MGKEVSFWLIERESIVLEKGERILDLEEGGELIQGEEGGVTCRIKGRGEVGSRYRIKVHNTENSGNKDPFIIIMELFHVIIKKVIEIIRVHSDFYKIYFLFRSGEVERKIPN